MSGFRINTFVTMMIYIFCICVAYLKLVFIIFYVIKVGWNAKKPWHYLCFESKVFWRAFHLDGIFWIYAIFIKHFGVCFYWINLIKSQPYNELYYKIWLDSAHAWVYSIMDKLRFNVIMSARITNNVTIYTMFVEWQFAQKNSTACNAEFIYWKWRKYYDNLWVKKNTYSGNCCDRCVI